MRYYINQDQLMDLIWMARKLDSLSLMEKLRVLENQKSTDKPELTVAEAKQKK